MPGPYERRARAVVLAIQQQLVERGHAPGYPDGLYGPRTKEAVESFERTEELPPDGIADRKTLRALFDMRAQDIELTSGEDVPTNPPPVEKGVAPATIAAIAVAFGLAFGAGRISKPKARARPGSR